MCDDDYDDLDLFPSNSLIKYSLLIGILMVLIGLPYYHAEAEKLKFYELISCNVYAIDYQKETCRSRDGLFECYRPIWRLTPIRDGLINTLVQSKTHDTLTEAVQEGEKYPVDELSPCWCDTRKPSIIQWEKPNTRFGMLLIIFGTALATIGIVLVFVRSYRCEKFLEENYPTISLEC